MKFPFFDPSIGEREYFALPYPSNSILKLLLDRSPKHARHALDNPSTAADTPALAFGRLFHSVLLQGGANVYVMPKDANRASNGGKRNLLAWMEEVTQTRSDAGKGLAEEKMLSARIEALKPLMSGIQICSQDDHDLAQRMRDAVMERSIGKAIFEDGKAEVAMGAEIMDVKIKAKMDWLPTDHHMVVDLKTTDDASYEAFRRSCMRYGYARQAALYRRVHRAVTGTLSEPAFVFVAVEKTPPFDVGFFEPDSEMIDRANREIDTALHIWARCEEAGVWPGIGWDWQNNEYMIQTLAMPIWARG